MTCDHQRHRRTFALLVAYVLFGILHELSHLVAAACLLPRHGSGGSPDLGSWKEMLLAALRAALGRYSLVQLSNDGEERPDAERGAMRMIVNAGWISSLLLALICHSLHVVSRNKDEGGSPRERSRRNGLHGLFLDPCLVVAAYVTVAEAIATDLLGFVPVHPHLGDSSRLVCFCGNFGVLLLNPSWLSIDGGRTALDVLEKMVNVTMMRGTLFFESILSTKLLLS